MNADDSTARLTCPLCAATYRAHFACCPADGTRLQPCPRAPLTGKTLARRYLIEAFLGEGAMGVVYRARDTLNRRTIAIKVLHGELAADTRHRLRLAREFTMMRRLRHPNLIAAIGYSLDPWGPPHLVMEYSHGETLRETIERAAPVSAAATIDLGCQLASALSHVHSAGLVHRDLKPENVILQRSRQSSSVPRIIDFGLAISRHELSHPSARLTAAGYAMGTPSYLAPEQVQQRSVDHRADLFSLGLILYELLVGRTPFDGTILQVIQGRISGAIPPMRERNPAAQVSPPLEAIVRRLLSTDPDRRFQTAHELLIALDGEGRARLA